MSQAAVGVSAPGEGLLGRDSSVSIGDVPGSRGSLISKTCYDVQGTFWKGAKYFCILYRGSFHVRGAHHVCVCTSICSPVLVDSRTEDS